MDKQKRWVYVVIGTLALLFAGIIYAWSVISAPVAAQFPQWSKAELSLTFTIAMAMFCLGGLAGGLLNSRLSPRITGIAAAVLLFAGFTLTSIAQSLTVFYLCFGILCGFGSGLAYNAVMSTVGKWFPDRQGLVSGILLMGFGIGSFIAGKIFQAWTPASADGWRTSYIVTGICVASVIALCSLFLKRPSAPPAETKKTASNAADMTPLQTLKTLRFWLFYVWAILITAAGLAVVSQAVGIAEAAVNSIPAATAATVVGLISIANGIGRIISGWAHDRFGGKVAMFGVCGLFLAAAGVIALALYFGGLGWLICGFVLSGLAYGGVPPLNSAFASVNFGLKHYPVNYSLINTNLLIASFGSTIAGALYDVSGSYMCISIMLIICAVGGVAATAIIAAIGKKNI